MMTTKKGCWQNFVQMMRDTWGKPLAVAQREAEERYKRPNETFHQFFFAKLKMLSNAFPESIPATHISRMRSKFGDSRANRFIREKYDLSIFGEECREYDEHLKMHPEDSTRKPSRYTFAPPGSFDTLNQLSGYRTQMKKPFNSLDNPPTLTSPPTATPSAAPGTGNITRKQLTWPGRKNEKGEAFRRRTDARIRIVADRLDPTTNKKIRSFQRGDGTIKFIERPCELCEKMGQKDKWHFSFECPAREKITSLIISTVESDTDSEGEESLPGVTETAFTHAPTSHIFNTVGTESQGKV